MLLFGCLFLLASVSAQTEPTLNDLAVQVCPSFFKQTLEDIITRLNVSSTPNDIPKFRQTPLLAFRSYIDLFYYDYPASVNGTDVFMTLEIEIGHLYKMTGAVQDLRKVNYTQSDLNKLLLPCLQWKDQFLLSNQNYDYLNFLSNPDPQWAERKSGTKPPGRFWALGNIEPKHKYTGYQNIARMQSAMLTYLIDQYKTLDNMHDLTDPKTTLAFHAYRKDSRGGTWVTLSYPQIYTNSTPPTNTTHLLHKFHTKLGEVHDKLVKYDYYEAHGETKKAAEAKALVHKDWTAVKKWMSSNEVYSVMKQVRAALIMQE